MPEPELTGQVAQLDPAATPWPPQWTVVPRKAVAPSVGGLGGAPGFARLTDVTGCSIPCDPVDRGRYRATRSCREGRFTGTSPRDSWAGIGAFCRMWGQRAGRRRVRTGRRAGRRADRNRVRTGRRTDRSRVRTGRRAGSAKPGAGGSAGGSKPVRTGRRAGRRMDRDRARAGRRPGSGCRKPRDRPDDVDYS
jgi:hypothetical protein